MHLPATRLEHALDYCRATRIVRGEKPQGYVYLIGCKGYVKIGYATKPKRRLAEMQCGNPFILRLLAVLPSWNLQGDEENLHNQYREYRMAGEWYNLPPDVLNTLIRRFKAH